MNKCWRFCLMAWMLTAGLLLAPASSAWAAERVDGIRVELASGGPTIPDAIAKRMEHSIQTVSEQLLLGKTVDEVASGKSTYEKLIREVFERVLVGYSVQQVEVVPGAPSTVRVAVAPWGDVVQTVKVETNFGDLSPEAVRLIERDMGDVSSRLNDMLVGLPIDSVDWAGSISKSFIRDRMAAQLPEFQTNLDITPGPVTLVHLSLLPGGTTIQTVNVSLRSQSIPNILLAAVRPALEDQSRILLGLPVAFVDRHRDELNQKFGDLAANHPLSKRYGLSVHSAIQPQSDTRIIVDTETSKYNLSLEGYLDFGRTQDTTSARLHAGKRVSSRDEAFLEVTFVPSTVAWQFVPGWGHRIGPNTDVGVKYDTSETNAILWLKQPLSENWSLRLERTPATKYDEFGLRYKLDEYLSAEYVFTSKDKWLRLVGNL